MPASRKSSRRQGGRTHPANRQRHAAARARAPSRKWSHRVMQTSDAMDIEHDIFKSGSADEIAQSLKRSAEHSRRRKAGPFQSAMSMLNFYINRAGRTLPRGRRAVLQQAKDSLRTAFGRPARSQR